MCVEEMEWCEVAGVCEAMEWKSTDFDAALDMEWDICWMDMEWEQVKECVWRNLFKYFK